MIDIVKYYLTETPAINGCAATTITDINTLIARPLISFDHAGAGSFIHSPSLRFINNISIIAQTPIPPNNTIDRLSPLTSKWAIDHVKCSLAVDDARMILYALGVFLLQITKKRQSLELAKLA
ncbi:MAG: hypothetical protein WBM38_12470 [Arenicellales bacterium]